MNGLYRAIMLVLLISVLLSCDSPADIAVFTRSNAQQITQDLRNSGFTDIPKAIDGFRVFVKKSPDQRVYLLNQYAGINVGVLEIVDCEQGITERVILTNGDKNASNVRSNLIATLSTNRLIAETIHRKHQTCVAVRCGGNWLEGWWGQVLLALYSDMLAQSDLLVANRSCMQDVLLIQRALGKDGELARLSINLPEDKMLPCELTLQRIVPSSADGELEIFLSSTMDGSFVRTYRLRSGQSVSVILSDIRRWVRLQESIGVP